jgi:hypothetical protein
MQIAKNKTAAIAIAIFLTLSMAASIMLVPTASAHTPKWDIPTYAYIQPLPNPVGVGQSVNIIMWVDKVIYGAQPTNDIRFQDYKLTITDPNGTVTTQTWAVVVDTTSSQGYTYTPTQVGTYTLNFTFPRQTYTYTEPINSFGFLMPNEYTNDTYLSSSASTTLTVQQEPVGIYPTTPLPTAYWTRPIYGENWNWFTVSSNWLGSGVPAVSSGVVIDAVGPLTGHVMWTKPLDMGGVVGGNETVIQGDTYAEGSAYADRYSNPIIIDGYLYYTEPRSLAGVPGFFGGTGYGPTDCVNLLTGKLIWSRKDVPALSFGYVYDVQDPNQHGVYPPILVAVIGGGFFAAAAPVQWEAFDAYTGDFMFNITNVPSGTTVLGPNGEHLIISLVDLSPTTMTPFGPVHMGPPQYYLQEWNSSRLWDNQYSGPSTTPQVVPPITDGSDPSLLDWNVSTPSLNTMPSTSAIEAAFSGNMLLCMSGSYPAAPSTLFSAPSSAPYTYFTINLDPSKGAIGSVPWTNTVSAPAGNLTVSFVGADPTTGVFVEYHVETMQWVGYSLTTGKKIWGPVGNQIALDFYWTGWMGLTGKLAYGNLYSCNGMGGIIYCYDLATGNLKWTYGNGGPGNSTNSGLPSTGQYPTIIYAIANGVIYTITNEHTYETPIYKGALSRGINATTGQEIWTVSCASADSGATAIADGYATWFNGYDNQIYVVGKGPSATTVQAPLNAITVGDKAIIQGTVMDISAGTKQDQQAADFPNGVPVASDASMSAWMGYVYQQQPLPTNFAGVSVTIDAIDPNNNFVHIGTATSDTAGKFSYMWTPPDVPGKYTIIATFAGTNGYYASYDETAAAVSEAPAATPPPQYPVPPDYTWTIVGMGIAIIIVVVIVGILLLRKK